ncbi:MAG: phytanoyl-CoA dioxygenase family protein [Pseudomonadales bacterium]|nr:phytanoyl-CoA dioxygenase family protein [Pseudomonadales bacterium]MCP5184510.1 phytanoyl-CoA dioxygenase family protein [Pseudomonadales bacterium]
MLADEQIAFFRTQGYLIVRGLLDVQACEGVRARMWEDLPARVRDRLQANPVGPFAPAEESTDSVRFRQGYRWLNRALGVSPAVIDLIYGEAVQSIAAQLLGGTLRAVTQDGVPMGSRGPAWPDGPVDPALGTEAARGVYCTLPYGDVPKQPPSCHTDGHPMQLGVVGLLADIGPDGGAFTVWPGSHARLFPLCALRYDQPRIPYYDHLPSLRGIVHSPAYLAEVARLNRDGPAVACHGRAGDVVFWHHRLAHMAGHNYGDSIREAVLADFWRTDFDALRCQPVSVDMWADWSEAVRSSDGVYSAAFAASQGLPGGV